MIVKKYDPNNVFVSPKGEKVCELIGVISETAENFSLAEVVLPQGACSESHYHPVIEEAYYILAGQARMIVDDEERTLDVGDSVMIPPGAKHQIFNDKADDLRFLAFCADAWSEDCSIFD